MNDRAKDISRRLARFEAEGKEEEAWLDRQSRGPPPVSPAERYNRHYSYEEEATSTGNRRYESLPSSERESKRMKTSTTDSSGERHRLQELLPDADMMAQIGQLAPVLQRQATTDDEEQQRPVTATAVATTSIRETESPSYSKDSTVAEDRSRLMSPRNRSPVLQRPAASTERPGAVPPAVRAVATPSGLRADVGEGDSSSGALPSSRSLGRVGGSTGGGGSEPSGSRKSLHSLQNPQHGGGGGGRGGRPRVSLPLRRNPPPPAAAAAASLEPTTVPPEGHDPRGSLPTVHRRTSPPSPPVEEAPVTPHEGYEKRFLVKQATELACRALVDGPWPLVTDVDIIMASLHRFSSDIILPALAAVDPIPTATNDAPIILGTLLMLREVLILNSDGIFGMSNGGDSEDLRFETEETKYASQSAYFATSTLATAVLLSALDSLDGTFPAYFSTRFLRMIDAYESKDPLKECFGICLCSSVCRSCLSLSHTKFLEKADKVNLPSC
jgi:hypothetical protein